MKVWMKDKRYKINKRANSKWWDVYFEDEVIATTIDEEQARVAIYKHSGEKIYVNEKDFENWGDNQFVYPERVENE